MYLIEILYNTNIAMGHNYVDASSSVCEYNQRAIITHYGVKTIVGHKVQHNTCIIL